MKRLFLAIPLFIIMVVLAVLYVPTKGETDGRFIVAFSVTGGLAGGIRDTVVFKSGEVGLRDIPSGIVYEGVTVHDLSEDQRQRARVALSKSGLWRWSDYTSGAVDVFVLKLYVRDGPRDKIVTIHEDGSKASTNAITNAKAMIAELARLSE